jgi:hypothetical protein
LAKFYAGDIPAAAILAELKVIGAASVDGHFVSCEARYSAHRHDFRFLIPVVSLLRRRTNAMRGRRPRNPKDERTRSLR